jgi:hypothetical protein
VRRSGRGLVEQVAAVRLRVRAGDREPEAGPRPEPRVCAPREALEQLRHELRRDTAARVLDCVLAVVSGRRGTGLLIARLAEQPADVDDGGERAEAERGPQPGLVPVASPVQNRDDRDQRVQAQVEGLEARQCPAIARLLVAKLTTSVARGSNPA